MVRNVETNCRECGCPLQWLGGRNGTGLCGRCVLTSTGSQSPALVEIRQVLRRIADENGITSEQIEEAIRRDREEEAAAARGAALVPWQRDYLGTWDYHARGRVRRDLESQPSAAREQTDRDQLKLAVAENLALKDELIRRDASDPPIEIETPWMKVGPCKSCNGPMMVGPPYPFAGSSIPMCNVCGYCGACCSDPTIHDLGCVQTTRQDHVIRYELGQPSAVASAPSVAPLRRARPYHTAVLYVQGEED